MSTPARLGGLASEIQAALALRALPIVGTPSPKATLQSYITTFSRLPPQTIAARLGASPQLFVNVDARRQVMPANLVQRLAAYLGRPVAEVVWACGGAQLTAPAPGLGRRPL